MRTVLLVARDFGRDPRPRSRKIEGLRLKIPVDLGLDGGKVLACGGKNPGKCRALGVDRGDAHVGEFDAARRGSHLFIPMQRIADEDDALGAVQPRIDRLVRRTAHDV